MDGSSALASPTKGGETTWGVQQAVGQFGPGFGAKRGRKEPPCAGNYKHSSYMDGRMYGYG